MKRLLFILLFVLLIVPDGYSQPLFGKYDQTLDYFMPKNFTDVETWTSVEYSGTYDPAVPKPKDVLGYELAEFYPEWHAVLNYMYALEKASDRVSVKTIGVTHEKRPIIQVVITSPKNQERLEEIRQQHLKLSDSSLSGTLEVADMPLVIANVNSIHGNEQSAVCSSLAVAYFFAASEDKNIQEVLDNTVLLLIPGMNPDGINRFSSYANSNSGIGTRIYDENSREYSPNENWPSSRANHYWTDLNRDLAMVQHPEGRTYVNMFCDWMPDILYDNHEQYQRKGLFFSPGDPDRVHPYIPEESQEVARLLGEYTAAAMTGIGEDYFTGSSYDDFYLGKGAAYGDVQGTVSILIEQLNTRGFVRMMNGNAVVTFADAVRNVAHVGVTAVVAAYRNREMLHNYQRDFFVNSAKAAEGDKVKGYVFNTRGDKVLEYYVLDWMKTHRFDIHRLAKDIKIDGVKYKAEDSYVVPCGQKFYLKFKGLWDDLTEYTATGFYDVSTWSGKRAFNVNDAKVSSVDGLIGEKVTDIRFPEGKLRGTSRYGYLIRPDNIYFHNVLRELLLKGVRVEIAAEPFKVGKQEYDRGTAHVCVDMQVLSPQKFPAELERISRKYGVDVEPLEEDRFFKVESHRLDRLPKVAMLTGRGMDAVEAGEIWYMLERHFGINPVKIDLDRLHKVKNLNDYDVVIAANGSPDPQLSSNVYKSLKKYVVEGGRIIATGRSMNILKKAALVEFSLKEVPSELKKKDPIKGVIIRTDIDDTDPLGYGYASGTGLPVFKRQHNFIDPVVGGYDSAPLVAAAEPYLSGYVSDANMSYIVSSPVVVTQNIGEGSVVYSTDNLTFRSYWYGAMKLFMNAVYFSVLESKPFKTEIDE